MWNVRLYYHTHLNTANTLDNATLLESADYLDVPALDILQAEGLSSISVKATRAQVKNVEYVRLTDTDSGDYFYYQAGIPQATSSDVQNIPIVIDAVLTMGRMYNGVHNIPFLDGIIQRHHVPKANDDYGAYTEEDPLLIPSKELELDSRAVFEDESLNPDTETRDDPHVILESTLSLSNMATLNQSFTYTDQQGSVTVPRVVAVPNNTNVFLNSLSTQPYKTPGSQYFDYDNQTVQTGVEKARALGVESGILNSYVIPNAYTTYTPSSAGEIQAIAGVKDEAQSGLNFEYANVENKRVLYGSLNSFVLASPANGVTVTFKPEDVFEANSSPSVIKMTDPRPSGRPYYNFKYFKGNDVSTDDKMFFRNALAGMEWANAPLLYTGKSGATLDLVNFQTASRGRDNIFDEQIYQMDRRYAMGAIDAGVGYGANMMQGYEQSGGFVAMPLYNNGSNFMAPAMQNAGVAGGIIGTAVQSVYNFGKYYENYAMSKDMLALQYKTTVDNEMMQFITGQIHAPAIVFPRSESLRDFQGNYVIVFRYRPSASDIQKLDKVLTMYGYKDTMPLVGSESVFHNRSKFNYVQATGVSIGGDAPRWLREACAAQLSAGVRIWHVIPTRTAYNAGENV